MVFEMRLRDDDACGLDNSVTGNECSSTSQIILVKCKNSTNGHTRYSITSLKLDTHAHTHTHPHPFNGRFSGITRVSRYQKGKTNLDCTEARDSEWQWHQLGHMQVWTSLQTNNHAQHPTSQFLQAG